MSNSAHSGKIWKMNLLIKINVWKMCSSLLKIKTTIIVKIWKMSSSAHKIKTPKELYFKYESANLTRSIAPATEISVAFLRRHTRWWVVAPSSVRERLVPPPILENLILSVLLCLFFKEKLCEWHYRNLRGMIVCSEYRANFIDFICHITKS